MKRTWLIFEKIFACFQVLVSFAVLCVDYNSLIEDGERVADRGHPYLRSSEILSQVQMWFPPVLFFIGGILLLVGKKLGWVLSISSWVSFLISVFLYQGFSQGVPWYEFALLFAIGIIPVAFMVQKPLLIKYDIGKKQWLIAVVLVIAISLASYWQRIF